MKNHSPFTLVYEPANPLPPCPDSPNCIRRTYRISSETKRIYSLVVDILEKMGAVSVQKDIENLGIQAVFKVVFFKDDVTVALESKTDHALLHIRSASRTGHYDFGVNKRRVEKFMRMLAKHQPTSD